MVRVRGYQPMPRPTNEPQTARKVGALDGKDAREGEGRHYSSLSVDYNAERTTFSQEEPPVRAPDGR